VNIVGSATLGALVAATVLSGAQTRLELLLDTGFCGALTTYSTFSSSPTGNTGARDMDVSPRWRLAPQADTGHGERLVRPVRSRRN